MARHVIKREDLYKEIKEQPIYKKTDLEEQEEAYVNHDHPSAIENGTATLWYIIIMVVGTIFHDRLLIWIAATVIWWRYINRKKIRQQKWNAEHKNWRL